MTKTGHWFYNLLFEREAPEKLILSFTLKCFCIVLLFSVTRFATILGFEYRQVDWLQSGPIYVSDPAGFVATANYLEQTGCMPTEDKPKYRQFAGLSLLMLAPNLFVKNMVWSGYLIVTTSAVLSLILIQYLFDDFRLSLITCVFLPYTITTTCTIFAEAPTMLCFLVGLWVLRDFRDRPVLLYLGIIVAGYCLVLRQSAGFFVIPSLVIIAWGSLGGTLFGIIRIACAALLPIAIYLLWIWVTIHQLFPQYKLHREAFLLELGVAHNTGRYSTTMLGIPFQSLIAGLTDSHERIGKRLSVLITVGTAFLALGLLMWTLRREGKSELGILALAFASALAVHMIFHFSLGGVFGYKWLDRHFSQLNPIIDWALFYQRNLRWPWIVFLVVSGVVFAVGTGPGAHYLYVK